MMPSRSVLGDGNHTSVAMFVLLGLLDQAELQLILFPVFLGTYLITLIWNLGLIILIRMDSHLQTPMYFFLSFLSFIDICYSSSISPRMLSDFLKAEKTISFIACATQYFVMAWMGASECCLLAAMAYDRYVAIGSPLQYSVIMAPSLCWRMVAGVYRSGFFSSFVQLLVLISTIVGQMSFIISSVTFLRSFPCLALIPSSASWFFSWQLFLLGLALSLLLSSPMYSLQFPS